MHANIQWGGSNDLWEKDSEKITVNIAIMGITGLMTLLKENREAKYCGNAGYEIQIDEDSLIQNFLKQFQWLERDGNLLVIGRREREVWQKKKYQKDFEFQDLVCMCI